MFYNQVSPPDVPLFADDEPVCCVDATDHCGGTRLTKRSAMVPLALSTPICYCLVVQTVMEAAVARKPDSDAAREAISRATIALIKERGTDKLTVDQVAKAAGVAKGLVHYHYKTKRGLFEAVAQEFAAQRRRRWSDAFGAEDPQAAIDTTWATLTTESMDGTLRAWGALFGSAGLVPEPLVKSETATFGRTLGEAARGMIVRLGLRPTIHASEVGWLLAAVVHGMGVLLMAGADEKELEGAYAAAWLGVLSLTRSA